MIGIVGGGISGLFLLHFLENAGVEAVLFESADLPGGVMRSLTANGPEGPVRVDVGPQRTRLTPALARVVEEVGLSRSVVRAPARIPFTIHYRGRFHPAPLSLLQAATTGLISTRGKLRALLDLVTPAPGPEETVAEAMTRKLGPEIYLRLAGPLFGGLYASDPRTMECRHTLIPVLRRAGSGRSLLRGLLRASGAERTPVVSFEEGMGALPQAIAARHAERIRFGDPVTEILTRPSGGFTISSRGGALAVDRLALTLPAPEAAALLSTAAPEASVALGRLRYNPLAVVPLVVLTEAGSPDVGSGFKGTLDADTSTRGVTAHGALFGRRGLFTAFLGGMGAEDVVRLPDSEIMELARAEFREVTGVDALPLLVHRTAMPAWDRSWSAMDDLTLPTGIHLCSAFANRPGIMGRLEDAKRCASRLSR